MTDFFGAGVAEFYDDPDDEMFQPDAIEPAVDVLARLASAGLASGGLAGGGRALELGIGTGRIALPLAARGVEVHGIDLSTAMVAVLRSKPGGDAIPVTIGDFAATRLDERFQVAYLVFNTIMNLTSQQAQVDCFRNVAEHLEPGGCFVIEVSVPELRRLPAGQTAVPFRVDKDELAFDIYDTATQQMSSNYVHIAPDGSATFRSIPFRYVWPAELDLMAQLAGLRLRDRWADWTGEPFTADSGKHVSTWVKP